MMTYLLYIGYQNFAEIYPIGTGALQGLILFNKRIILILYFFQNAIYPNI